MVGAVFLRGYFKNPVDGYICHDNNYLSLCIDRCGEMEARICSHPSKGTGFLRCPSSPQIFGSVVFPVQKIAQIHFLGDQPVSAEPCRFDRLSFLSHFRIA